jgi:hypothetical protein
MMVQTPAERNELLIIPHKLYRYVVYFKRKVSDTTRWFKYNRDKLWLV